MGASSEHAPTRLSISFKLPHAAYLERVALPECLYLEWWLHIRNCHVSAVAGYLTTRLSTVLQWRSGLSLLIEREHHHLSVSTRTTSPSGLNPQHLSYRWPSTVCSCKSLPSHSDEAIRQRENLRLTPLSSRSRRQERGSLYEQDRVRFHGTPTAIKDPPVPASGHPMIDFRDI